MQFPKLSLCAALVAVTLVIGSLLAETIPGGRVIDSATHHIGYQTIRAWGEASKAEGTWIERRFEVENVGREATLAIDQRNVTNRWTIELNGESLGTLKRNMKEEMFYYRIPAGVLKTGQNVLRIASKFHGDMQLGPFQVYEQSYHDLFHLRAVDFRVTDTANGKAVPARVTITDTNDQPVEFFYAESPHTAVRHGILYTLGDKTHVELPAGEYRFYSTRGMEWSRGSAMVSLHESKPTNLTLKMTREVDTTGFVAADTHIHTLTFSGHGDASVEERTITLAGEGIELAIATDHNHNTDYRPYQQKLGLNKFFTPVVGNEVSTPVGHMNGFPLDPKGVPPEPNLQDWVQLVDGIRAKGAKVVTLNHPRWEPLPIMVRFGLNSTTGDFAPAKTFPFDCMEVANALVPVHDPLTVFHDWFGLLNHGFRITGLASSDSHEVGEPVGQGRSYVPSKTDNPSKIAVSDACQHYLRGETSISLGIFADVLVDGRYKMGQTNSVKKSTVDVNLRVAAPSWVQPRRALVFLNGEQVAEKAVPEHAPDKPTAVHLDFCVPTPKHDAYVVCVILGDGVSHPSWHTVEKFTVAATNPVFLDCDGDGKYSSPRETARALLAQAGSKFADRWKSIENAEDGISLQMISLLRENADDSAKEELDHALSESAKTRPAFATYLKERAGQTKASQAAAK